jgi:hypothetical protein
MCETWIQFRVHVFWVITPCSVVLGYQLVRGPYCLHLQGPLKRWYPTTTLHGITTQKNSTWNIWRWRQYGPLKRWYPTTKLHGVTTQKTSTRNIAAMKASNSHLNWVSSLAPFMASHKAQVHCSVCSYCIWISIKQWQRHSCLWNCKVYLYLQH